MQQQEASAPEADGRERDNPDEVISAVSWSEVSYLSSVATAINTETNWRHALESSILSGPCSSDATWIPTVAELADPDAASGLTRYDLPQTRDAKRRKLQQAEPAQEVEDVGPADSASQIGVGGAGEAPVVTPEVVMTSCLQKFCAVYLLCVPQCLICRLGGSSTITIRRLMNLGS